VTGINHSLTGAATALAVNNPELVIPLAFLSHFAVDVIPHFHATTAPPKVAKAVVYADFIVTIGLVVWLSVFLKTNVAGWIIFSGAIAALSPDFVWVWRYFKHRDVRKVASEPMSKFSKFHQQIQWSESHWGAIVEACWAIFFVFLIVYLTK